VSVDTPEQLDGLRAAGAVVAATIDALRRTVAPGVSTVELDRLAAELLAAGGARSGPIITYGFPGSICLCVDDEVVHGIPGPRRLEDGQLLTIDVAAELDGYHADAAVTVAVGTPDATARRLISGARAALAAGIEAARPGATLREVGGAIERITEARGLRVVRELTGHGIGRGLHEPPSVPHWPAPWASTRLTPGLVFTIEPMVVAGKPWVYLDDDGWTVRTRDRGRCAHEEHTIMVAEGGPVLITAPA
jgi:methionyl aminopeptidase